MISTRAYAALDYGVAALLGGTAAVAPVPLQQRRLLGAAACYYAGSAAVTDHAGGLLPAVSTRQHRALDTAGALAFGGAAFLMRNANPAVRALLIGTAAMKLGALAFSSAGPSSRTATTPDMCRTGKAAHAEGVGYPPLDMPKPVADGVFIVDSLLPGRLGSFLPVRMTVVRLSNGDLLLHSPTGFKPALQRALEAIGPIRHLVAPNFAHWMFLQD